METTGFINMLLAVGAAIGFNGSSFEKGSTMPKYMSLLKCLNCGNYSAGQKMLHREDCIGPVVVEVITQKVAVYCLNCGGVVETEPRRCSSCGDVPFGPVYKEPTLSRMEKYVHLVMDALAKSQAGLELGEMPYQEPPDLESEEKGK